MSTHKARIRVVILDLDGVIYRGRTPLPGARETTEWLHHRGYQTYYLTNNSTRTRDSYVSLLADFRIQADRDHIVTSASLTALYFRDIGALDGRRPRPTVMVVGEGGLADELRDVGLRVVRRRGAQPVAYVVAGMDRKFTYAKLYEAQQAIRAGAQFVATNRDATYPVEDNVIPGGGSIVAALATAAEQEPILIGKPSARAGELILRQAGVAGDEALMIGDRLETDIEMGRRAGLWTCLVLSGISQADEVDSLPPESRPHWIIPGIWELPQLLSGSAAGGGAEEGPTPAGEGNPR